LVESHCPICYTELETREVAPCYDCGALPEELEHFKEGKHTYAELKLFGATIVLCDFCQADFDSYAPSYFRRTGRPRFSRQMSILDEVTQPTISKDKYCPNCHRRLAFFRFLARALETADTDRSQ
jgi:hypothetical protein